MTVDVAAFHKAIADGLLYDLREPTAASGLHELDSEGRQKDSPLKDYPAWRKAFDQLVKEVGIRKDPVRGMVAPDGLKPEGVSKLTKDQMKLLVDFGSSESVGSRRLVQSSRASLFLGDFHRRYSPLFIGEIHEKALHNAAEKMTKWWQKYVEKLMDIIKDNKYLMYKITIENANLLADDPTVPNTIGTGFAKPEHFRVDPEKLREALSGRGRSASAVSEFGTLFFRIHNTAKAHSHSHHEAQMKQMQLDYMHDVKPALEEYKNLDKSLQPLAQQGRTP
jgi:hypothetical protein